MSIDIERCDHSPEQLADELTSTRVCDGLTHEELVEVLDKLAWHVYSLSRRVERLENSNP